MAITWSEMMSVGVPALDDDHKTLVGLINHLHRSVGDEEEYATLGSVLAALEEYALHHFAREEKTMAACRYPQIIQHTAYHYKLADQVRTLKARYDEDRTSVRAKDCLAFLHKWLIEHICSTDMDYRPWLIGRAAAMSAAESVSMTGSSGASLDWRTLRMLVVDDNLNFCQILRTVLEGVGVRDIATVPDLTTARAALQSGVFDVVVADWHVGNESGLDLVAWIRRGPPELATMPVLMLSGHERIANRDVALSAGADEFMEKPISARGLLLCLARLMRRREHEHMA
jgi:hemerythrin-like metal-binding protein